MRLHREVSAILRAACRDLHGESLAAVDALADERGGEPLPDLLTAVLVDPDLYTDLLMRLHREIRAVLTRAHESDPV
jgi:hypothetical protein